jgi:tRNA-splicing ligase RtcB
MADHHKGYAVPIGEVPIEPDQSSGVGFDIACGNKAVLLDMPGTSPEKISEKS